MNVCVRDAVPADAAAVTEIYNHYVTGSVVTFDTEPISLERHEEWLASAGERHPVLVAEQDGTVVGYGSLTKWATRPAWHRTVELSVYVRDDTRGEGIGPILMEALLERAAAVGHHVVMAQIVADNEPSLAMAERFGFERVGVLREVGEKFGRYLDLVLLQRILA